MRDAPRQGAGIAAATGTAGAAGTGAGPRTANWTTRCSGSG